VADEFQTIHRTSDPIEAEILADLLGQKGIDARVLGTRHGASIGVAQHILQLRIEVPRHQAEAACELVDAYVAAQGPDEPKPRRLDPPRLRAVLAAGVVAIVPGGGHFYARRPAAALVVILGYLGAFSTLLLVDDREKVLAAVMLLGGMALFDLVGAQRAVRAFNRGVRASIKEQLAVSLSVLAAVALSSRLLAPHLPVFEAEVGQPVPPPPPLPLFEGTPP
jgi:hypothetical protein